MKAFRVTAAVALALLIAPAVKAQSVTVILEDHLGNVATPFNDFSVPGLTDYVGRPKFDARTGGANADQDVRNITAAYTTLGGSVTNVLYDINTVPSVISNNTLPAVTGDGFLRVGYQGEAGTAADAAWNTQYSGGYANAEFNFDVRFTEGTAANDNADGFGFAYVDESQHGSTGAFYTAGEEPNVAGSLGIGFDIWDNGDEGPNSISVHYDGSVLGSVDLATLPSGGAFPLIETGEPIGVKVIVQAAPLLDVTRPGDPIALVNGTNAPPDTNDGPPPGAEGVENAINDIGQKYLNFLDLGSGFAVTPSGNPGGAPVTGVRLYTANDAVDRDPSSFVLSGSNGSIDGPWTDIHAQVLSLPEARNAGGDAVAIPPEGNLSAVHQTVTFANDLSFDHYRVIFPTIKNEIAANSMQIAEVELLMAVPEPTTGLLALLGLASLFLLRRRSTK